MTDRICSSIESVRRHTPARKPGYEAALIAESLPGSPYGCLCWTAETYLKLKAKYALPPPTIPQLLLQFGRSLAAWRNAGYPITPFPLYRHRLATCRACPEWQEDAYLGLGKCQACNCTGIKHWLQTEACPLKNW
jgi:hypothetical protein